MCFYKTRQSKVLIAKRDIKVYKIGAYADEGTFKPFFYNDFEYPVNQIVFENVDFTYMIERGLHSYITCELAPYATDMRLYSGRNFLYSISVLIYTVYLGEFIIPKGATYCLNRYGEVVSDKLMYTGNHVKIHSGKTYNSKGLWKEKQVKYLLIKAKPIKQ